MPLLLPWAGTTRWSHQQLLNCWTQLLPLSIHHTSADSFESIEQPHSVHFLQKHTYSYLCSPFNELQQLFLPILYMWSRQARGNVAMATSADDEGGHETILTQSWGHVLVIQWTAVWNFYLRGDYRVQALQVEAKSLRSRVHESPEPSRLFWGHLLETGGNNQSDYRCLIVWSFVEVIMDSV